MSDSLSPDERNVDAQLRAQVTQLRSELAGVTVGEFTPSRTSSVPLVAVAAVLMALALGGWFVLRDGTTVIDTSPATTPDTPNVSESAQVPESIEGIDPSRLERYSTSKDEVVLEELLLPAVGESIMDPAFGGRITRITNADEGEFITPQSPTAFNANETLAVLYRSSSDGTQHLLYDLQDSGAPKALDITPTDIEQVYWSRTNPDKLHYVETGTANFMTLNVVSGAKTSQTLVGCDVLSSGILPAPASADGTTWGLVCLEGQLTGLVNFSSETGEATSTKESTELLGLFPSLSGEWFIQLGDDGSAIVRDPDLAATGVTLELEANDFVAAVDGQGRDVVIAALFGEVAGTAVSFDLESGTSTVLIGEETGYGYPPSGTRHSASMANGLFASMARGSGFANGTPGTGEATLLAGELVLVDSRGPQVKTHRLAHHRESGETKWGKVFISLSPSGSKLLFSSDWFRGDRVDTFIIDLES